MTVAELASGRTSAEPPGWIDVATDVLRTRLVLGGEVDIRLSGKLTDAVSYAIALGRPVDVDSRAVTIVDSSLMGQIARLANAVEVRLVAPPALVADLLLITQLGDMVSVVDAPGASAAPDASGSPSAA